MRTLRTISLAAGVATLLFGAATAFAAEGRPATAGMYRTATTSAAAAQMRDIERAHAAAASISPESIQALREAAQNRVQAVRTKAEQHLTEIQDKAKQQEALKLAGQFQTINTAWTDKFVKTLNSYDAILQKAQVRASIAATGGKDISTTTAAILAANNAIATARLAVAAQVAKTYTLATSTAALPTATTTPKSQGDLMKALRASFNNLHQALFKDLFALRDGPMTAARKAVQAAVQTLGKIPGIEEGNHATSTATTTHQ
ncbi:MAG: hypothetical protein ACHQU0_01590 [Candidatus Paceibacteria bacterium]